MTIKEVIKIEELIHDRWDNIISAPRHIRKRCTHNKYKKIQDMAFELVFRLQDLNHVIHHTNLVKCYDR